jgi:hypothetical protein
MSSPVVTTLAGTGTSFEGLVVLLPDLDKVVAIKPRRAA